MKHPDIRCENCMAFEANEKTPGQGYCHMEPIKGHVVQAPAQLDLRINAQTSNQPNFKIVPSFPPTLTTLWCMKIQLEGDMAKKIMEEKLRDSGGMPVEKGFGPN